jgi:hypothetical protein
MKLRSPHGAAVVAPALHVFLHQQTASGRKSFVQEIRLTQIVLEHVHSSLRNQRE